MTINFRVSQFKPAVLLLGSISLQALLMTAVAPAQTYTTIFMFRNVNTGVHPTAGLIRDADGTLYGTTFDGGGVGQEHGFGTIYKLDSAGNESVLYRFTGYFDGFRPIGRLVANGRNLVGATSISDIEDGTGSIYQLNLDDGTETNLAQFIDDTFPTSGLVRDRTGNMYGTINGGNNTYGSIYEIGASGGFAFIFNFTGRPGGVDPNGQLALDSGRNIYGVTPAGGGVSNLGVIFKLTPTRQEIVLHAFAGMPDGGRPLGGLVGDDAAGNFYGTTSKGGTANAGTIFKVDAAGSYSVLYSFTGGADGADPEAELIVDASGNLYGTARLGGAKNLGTVFELRADGRLSVLHTFQGGLDGSHPAGGLLRDGDGNLYGTARTGGGSRNGGTVFKISPQ